MRCRRALNFAMFMFAPLPPHALASGLSMAGPYFKDEHPVPCRSHSMGPHEVHRKEPFPLGSREILTVAHLKPQDRGNTVALWS